MQNTEINTKRKLFLKKLEKRFKKKRQKLVLAPNIFISYLLAKLGVGKQAKATLFWGKSIYLNASDIEGLFLNQLGFLYGKAEYKLTKFLIKTLKEYDIFYDIGASYGFYTHLALEFCKEVYSFEPLPEVFKYLERNLRNNQNVFLNNIAVSKNKGMAELFLSNNAGLSTIRKDSLHLRNHHYNKKVKVATLSLDEYLKDKSKPTIMKIDVEGAESLVIEGAKNFLKNNSLVIAMEVWSQDNGGDVSMQAVEKLRSLHFKSYLINQRGELERIDGNLSKKIKKSDNFVFIKA